ncbi:hypothetical protein [Candidatus Endoriftia persephonae]|jgi:cytochrome c553|uniref:Green heme protein n=2 Tax=Gammaproteobacteria TaxID=1236 RepID=G2FIP8_9GAMM|nr:hypothetical protein [Candidatus Endoriftia persephone]EGW53360.1 green heme protein [endosymbiont of Tevnia jerichonana (vent Tica)]USF86497.1 cytochrome c [Candidatus Endoriftia persephone]
MKQLIPASILACLSIASSASAADQANGKQLIDTHCYKCHGTEIYTRPDRRVTSLPGLYKQVQRCELMLGLKWFDDDINDASTHLNQHFYKFK